MDKSNLYSATIAGIVTFIGGYIILSSSSHNINHDQLSANNSLNFKMCNKYTQISYNQSEQENSNNSIPFCSLGNQKSPVGCWIQCVRGILQSFGADNDTLKDNDINFYNSIRKQYSTLNLPYFIHEEHEDTMISVLSQYNISSEVYNIQSNGDGSDINEFNNFFESKINNTHKPIAIHLDGHWILLTGINGNTVSIYNSLPVPGMYNNLIMYKSSFYNFILQSAPTDGSNRKLINILVPNSDGITNAPETVDLNVGGIWYNTLTIRSSINTQAPRSISYYRSLDKTKYFVLYRDGTKYEFNSEDEIQRLSYEDLENLNLEYSQV